MNDKLPKKIIEMRDELADKAAALALLQARKMTVPASFTARINFQDGFDAGFNVHAELTKGLVEALELCLNHALLGTIMVDGEIVSLTEKVETALDAYKKELESTK